MGARVGRPGPEVRRLPLALGAALLVSGGAVLGHEGATGIVKQRMDDMKLIGRSTKRIDERLRSKRPLREIVADAEAIHAAAIRMPTLFPAGSRDGHTEATSAVWERWPEFVASSRALADASEKLATAARIGDAPEAAAQLRLVTRTCSECHQTFRAKH